MKTFHDTFRPIVATEAANKWLMQQDGRIDVKSVVTHATGRMDMNFSITIIYEVYDGARLSPDSSTGT
jgi:hypothetical protein